ncbi:MAG: hypothetical protein FWG88_02415 [Oscillospiraceae bacterium]|nr:hypothetical protein [Oscillospiraceae bacterium]
MVITNHASDRIRERCGLPKKAVERNVKLAIEKGLTHHESNGKLRKYFEYLSIYNGVAREIRLYSNHVYIFGKNEWLITVLPLPNEHKAAMQKAMKRKYA